MFKDEFFVQVGPLFCTWGHFCPEIFIGVLVITRVAWVICARDFNGGDFLHPVAWDYLCPKRKILPGSNYYCEEDILPVFP